MRTLKYFVVHHAAGDFGESSASFARDTIDRWHRDQGWSQIGYHYVIKDGNLVMGRPLPKIGAHTKGFNKYSVGVLFAYDARTKTDLPHEDILAFEALRKSLALRFGCYLPVLGHSDLARTECPGSYHVQINNHLM